MVYPGIEDDVNRFEVSTHGRLKNIKTGYIYKPNVLNTGYSSVRTTLGSESRKIHIIMHKAVAYTFLPNPNNLPEVNHKDGKRSNNCVENLEWCSSHENQQHKYDAGLFDKTKISGENNHMSKLTWDDVRFIRGNYCPRSREFGVRALARKFDVSRPIIKNVIENRTWIIR